MKPEQRGPPNPPSFSWLVKQHECFTYLFLWLKTKSLSISRAVISFYETEFEIIGLAWGQLGSLWTSYTFWDEFSLDQKKKKAKMMFQMYNFDFCIINFNIFELQLWSDPNVNIVGCINRDRSSRYLYIMTLTKLYSIKN